MNTKKFIQILAVSATALITACEEELTSFDCETPITVTSQVSEKTRAGYDNANLPSAFVMDINQGSEGYNYSLVTMSRVGNTATYNAPASTLLLWKGTDHSGANIKAMTIPDGLSTIDPTNPMAISVRTDQTTPDAVKASDLLGAKTGDGITINGDAINIEFRHLMSKLYVEYEFVKDLKGDPKVKSIKLVNTCVQGGYSYNEMKHVDDMHRPGDIMMCKEGENAYEAIFIPYNPNVSGDAKLEVCITVDGAEKTLTCPVVLKDDATFEGGKKYVMKILINGHTIDGSFITLIKEWNGDDESIVGSGFFAGKKILWIGTSIPDGYDYKTTSYPELIAKATGCKIINNAVAASSVIFFENLFAEDLVWYMTLSASHEEINNKFASNQTLREYAKQYSYETLITPHIDGSEGYEQCDVIVIDHGVNDRAWITNEASATLNGVPQRLPNALEWLDGLNKREDHVIHENYKAFIGGAGWGVKDKISYISAMNHIIDQIKAKNPNVQIIIGNCIATIWPDDLPANRYFGLCAVKANQAIARMNNLPIVDAYQYTGLDDNLYDNLCGGNNDLYTNIFKRYCPDGLHPGSDEMGTLNKLVAGIYIEKLLEIFGK